MTNKLLLFKWLYQKLRGKDSASNKLYIVEYLGKRDLYDYFFDGGYAFLDFFF